jgi:hypothetical protein
VKLEPVKLDRSVSLVHHIDERGVWASKGRRVFYAATSGADWQEVAGFPRSNPKDLFGVGRLARRLLRSEKCSLHPTREGKLLGIRRSGVYDLSENAGIDSDSELVPLFRIHGGCVMPRAIAEDDRGRIYFGEYFGNGDRVPVRIWRLDPLLETHEIAYEFPAGKIRHVHAVHSDPFVPGRMWVTTGDFTDECHLIYTDDYFETAHYLGAGNQLWRMVGIIFREDRLCWLTDTHFEQNYVVSMDRSRCEAEIVAKRDASSWYAAKTQDGICLATTTVELGDGIQTDQVRLLASEDGLEWEPVAEFRKDPYPMTGFGFGSISLPAGRFDRSAIWLSGEGVHGLEGVVQLGQLRF